MENLNILLVEDNPDEIATCSDTAERFGHQNEVEVVFTTCKSVEEASTKLGGHFDGAIVDLILDKNQQGGNEVVKAIETHLFRFPVVIMTGTPEDSFKAPNVIEVFKKGETGYDEIFARFLAIHRTGLTRIMGGKGMIEETLKKVFSLNLLPQMARWSLYGEANPDRAEQSLLRHTLNHLAQLIEDDSDSFFPEEVYLYPSADKNLRTGKIVHNPNTDKTYVILSPACDLAIRQNGKFKTDRLLVAEIEDHDEVKSSVVGETKNTSKVNKVLRTAFNNSHVPYRHWLPETEFFQGGFINFRMISAFSNDEFKEYFSVTSIQISPSFIKDVVSRFSTYYARQGQPNIDCSAFLLEE